MLELSHVTKRFGTRTVVDDLCLTVPDHCIFGFVGENGAGKTTTMKMILGLLDTDAGEIRVHGEQVSFGKSRANHFIGYLPDVPEFYGFLTPEEYLLLCGEISGISKKEGKERAKELLENTGLRTYEVAQQAGFVDESYFSKTFKRLTGKRPSAFRKRNGT